MCLIVLGRVAAALPARRRRARWASRCSSTCATGSASQGGIPDLPAGWYAESALASAGGTPFAGDFFVATLARPTRLELAVVDVSGKGEEAGTRALLLSGAFGGLLGALPPTSSCPPPTTTCSARTGRRASPPPSTSPSTSRRQLRGAHGRPPAGGAAPAGSGPLERAGQRGADPRAHARTRSSRSPRAGCGRDDALLLYTDGMVEEPRRDIDLGIDRMLGEAEHLLRGSFDGAARRLVDALGLARRRPRDGARFAQLRPLTGRFPGSVGDAASPRSRGCSSMVEPQSSKLATRVRFPSSAPSRVHGRRHGGPGAWFGGA